MSGSLNLRNLHNESYVAVYEDGQVAMQGVDGSTNVFMKKGELDVQVSHVGNESRLHVEEGNINLKVADNQPVKVVDIFTCFCHFNMVFRFVLLEQKSRLIRSLLSLALLKPKKIITSIIWERLCQISSVQPVK